MKIATLNMCQHQHRKHLCDNGTTSAMEYWWCPDCGSLGSRGGGDVAVLKWDLPSQLTCDHRWWTDGPDKQEVLDVYDDTKVCSQWGVLNVNTESKIMGNMIHRTIKVRHSDGSVGLGYEWVTEDDAKNL